MIDIGRMRCSVAKQRSLDHSTSAPWSRKRIKVRKRGIHCASLIMGGATTVLRDIDDMARPRGDVMEDPRCACQNLEMSHTSKESPHLPPLKLGRRQSDPTIAHFEGLEFADLRG